MINKKRLAFTLIELLVVIAVIGILSGLIVVSMSGTTAKASLAKAQIFNNSMRNALLSNLKGEWTLDGTPSDLWTNTTGTSYNTPTAGSNCPQNGCYTFASASSQYVTTPNTGGQYSMTTNPMAAMIWVKGAAQTGRTVFANWDNTATTYKWAWKIGSNGTNGALLGVWLADSTTPATNLKTYFTTTNYKAFDDVWHLVGFSWSGGGATAPLGILTVYIDGVAIPASGLTKTDTGTVSSLNANGSTALAVISLACEMTSAAPTAGTYFNGSLDGARLFNAAIPASVMKQEYYAGINNLLAKGVISQEEYSERINKIALK